MTRKRTHDSKRETRLAIFIWIDSWYSPTRRHFGRGYFSPNNFNRKSNERNPIPINYDAHTGRNVLDALKKMPVKIGPLQIHDSSSQLTITEIGDESREYLRSYSCIKCRQPNLKE